MKFNKKTTSVPSKGKSSEGTSDKSPPVTRGRPASQRKKFKKSLGPDFLDPLELGPVYSTKRSSAYASDLKANSSSPINSNVNIGSHSPASSSSSNLSTVTSNDKLNDDRRTASGHSLLKCAKCRIEVSASTLGSPFAKLTSSQVSSALWTCLSCVTNGASSKCTYCNSNSAEFLCSKCQVARFHLRCLKSHTKSQGQLVCSSCRSSPSAAQPSNPSKSLSPSTVVKSKSDPQVSSPAPTDDAIQNGRKLVDGKDDSCEPTPAKRQRKTHSNTIESRLQETLDAPTATVADDVSEEKSQVVSEDAQVEQTNDEARTDSSTPQPEATIDEEPQTSEPQVVAPQTEEKEEEEAAHEAATEEGDVTEEEKMVVDESEGQTEDAAFMDADADVDADADASKDAPSVNSIDQPKGDDGTSESNYKETQISSQLTEVSNLSQAKSEASTESVATANCADPSASVASNSSSESTSSSINDESKANYRFRPPETWSVDEVEQFITSTGFPNESSTFKEQEIDGKSLLLLKRQDVLTGLGFKLGPALKLYSFIHHLQNFNLVTVLPTPPGSVTAESIVDQESNPVSSSNVNSATNVGNCSSTTTTSMATAAGVTTTTTESSATKSTTTSGNELKTIGPSWGIMNIDDLPSEDLTGENSRVENESADQETINPVSENAVEDAVNSTTPSSSTVQNDNNNSSSASTATLKPCFVA